MTINTEKFIEVMKVVRKYTEAQPKVENYYIQFPPLPGITEEDVEFMRNKGCNLILDLDVWMLRMGT